MSMPMPCSIDNYKEREREGESEGERARARSSRVISVFSSIFELSQTNSIDFCA